MRTHPKFWGYKNENRCPRCKQYTASGFVCSCSHDSVDYDDVRRRRKRDQRRGHFEAEILRANRRIQSAALRNGVTLPYKVSVRERSREYRTFTNNFRTEAPLVDLRNVQTGAVVAAAVDVQYWAGDGTKLPISKEQRERQKQDSLLAWFQRKWREERGEPEPEKAPKPEAPLIRWLLDGANGTPPQAPPKEF